MIVLNEERNLIEVCQDAKENPTTYEGSLWKVVKGSQVIVNSEGFRFHTEDITFKNGHCYSKKADRFICMYDDTVVKCYETSKWCPCKIDSALEHLKQGNRIMVITPNGNKLVYHKDDILSKFSYTMDVLPYCKWYYDKE